jgi:MFS family permease
VLAIFALGNSTDAYLLLRLSGIGVPVAVIPLLWALLHVVKASASVAGGLLADRWGRRPVITAGWIVYGAVYTGFAIASGLPAVVTLFLVYGVFFGLTEGVEKALVADLTPSHLRGTAFGLYNGVTGFGTLAASLIFGGIWEVFGPGPAFTTGAALALAAAALLWIMVTPPRDEASPLSSRHRVPRA